MIFDFGIVLGVLFDLKYCKFIFNLCYGGPLEIQYC